MEKLRIEYIPVAELRVYENNTRKHGQEDVGKIAKSIQKYGFNDPIGIWKDNVIIEGHGRLEAAKLLGVETVPCIRLDYLTDEQRREYAIAHNRTAEFSEWDFEQLEKELDELEFEDFDLDFDKEFEADTEYVDGFFESGVQAKEAAEKPEYPKQVIIVARDSAEFAEITGTLDDHEYRYEVK